MAKIKTVSAAELSRAAYDAAEANPFVQAKMRIEGLASYRNTEGTTASELDAAKARAVGSHEPHADLDPFKAASHRARMAALTPEQQAAVKTLAGDDLDRQESTITIVQGTWGGGQ